MTVPADWLLGETATGLTLWATADGIALRSIDRHLTYTC